MYLKQAFEVDERSTIKIDPDLAHILGALILSTDTKNPALLALAHQICKTKDKNENISDTLI